MVTVGWRSTVEHHIVGYRRGQQRERGRMVKIGIGRLMDWRGEAEGVKAKKKEEEEEEGEEGRRVG